MRDDLSGVRLREERTETVRRIAALNAELNGIIESALLSLASKLVDNDYAVSVFDPDVDIERLTGDNKRQALGKVPNLAALMAKTSTAALADADVIVVGNAGANETREIIEHYRGQPVIDLQGIADLKKTAGAKYASICW